jgi:hypothetical protein
VTTLSRGGGEVYTFDREGRPVSWWDGAATYKRSLASEVHARRRGSDGRVYETHKGADAMALFERVAARAREALSACGAAAQRERLERIAAWTPARLASERSRFDAAYRPISILPPDQYLSVVLQATFGCSWNRCTFCDFYQGHPFSARPQAEFESHVEAVRALLGAGAALRRSIFLADGNALVLSNERLRPLFEAARATFPGRGFAGFLDFYTGERKAAWAWRALGALGLEAVHLGVESGHAPLLDWMNKPGGFDATLELATALKSAGLRIAAIFLVGAGGTRFAREHTRETTALIERLPLAGGDIVYLSPFVEHPDSEYARRARAEDVAALDAAAMSAQHAAFRDAVRRAHPSVRVARYDLREFFY